MGIQNTRSTRFFRAVEASMLLGNSAAIQRLLPKILQVLH